MIIDRLKELGYDYKPKDLKFMTFDVASRVGNLIFTSGQISLLDEKVIKGKIGTDVDIETAKLAAEICVFNCLCAAGAVVDINEIKRVVKVNGMVNVADGFNNTTEVINGCSDFINKVFAENGGHTRSAVGVVLPSNFAVEVEMIFSLE